MTAEMVRISSFPSAPIEGKARRMRQSIVRRRARARWCNEVVRYPRAVLGDERMFELASLVGDIQLADDADFRAQLNDALCRYRASVAQRARTPSRAETNATLRLLRDEVATLQREPATAALTTGCDALAMADDRADVGEWIEAFRYWADISGTPCEWGSESCRADVSERLADRLDHVADLLEGLSIATQSLLGMAFLEQPAPLSFLEALSRLAEAVDHAVKMLAAPGPRSNLALRRLAVTLAGIFEHYGSRPVTHHTSQQRCYTGRPESAFGKFVVAALVPDPLPRGLFRELSTLTGSRRK